MAVTLNKTSLPSGLSDSDHQQLLVLKVLYLALTEEARTFLDVEDIGSRLNIEDEKETWRLLYILEGQKLVAPVPTGDLTSRRWMITDSGVKAVKQFGI